MNRQVAIVQNLKHSHHASANRHFGIANRSAVIADRRELSLSPAHSMMDQVTTVHHSADEVVADLLQQTLSIARKMPGMPSQRVVDHLRLAISAHAQVHPRPLKPVALLRRADGLSCWQAATAERLILEQLDSQVLTATLARACALSRGHFSRLFKKTFGLPPHKWQRERRLEMARELMRDACCALADIAIRCGFNDQAHFTRAFKNESGMTPMAWRRKYASSGAELQGGDSPCGGVSEPSRLHAPALPA